MEDDQAHLEPWDSQNSLFKHFQGYLGILRDIDAYLVTLKRANSRRGRWGGLPDPFLKIEKSGLVLEKKRP